MRIVSCPSSLGSAVESESSRCLEDDMFEDVMYKYVREEARCDLSDLSLLRRHGANLYSQRAITTRPQASEKKHGNVVSSCVAK